MNPPMSDHAPRDPEIARQAQDQLQAILARSTVDLEFRRRLLQDPHGAIAEATGQRPPPWLRIRFLESEGYATIILPDVLPGLDGLPDDALREVCGGTGPEPAMRHGAAS